MFGEPLAVDALGAINDARSGNAGTCVSPITAWEVGILVARGRPHLAMPPETWFETLLEQPGLRLAGMAPRVLIASTMLPGSPPRDPADRIIGATCRQHGFLLITRDRTLLAYGGSRFRAREGRSPRRP